MKYDLDSPFQSELIRDTQRRADGESILEVNGSPMGRAIWNLIISKRDLELYCAKFSDGRPMKARPHRHWRVTDVKKYFGIKGTGDKLLERFMVLYTDVMGDE